MPPHLPLLTVLTTLLLTTPTLSHSWIEQIALISPNGTYYTPFGYPRGYIARTDPGYSDSSMTHLLPALSTYRTRINSSDLLCASSQSSTSSHSAAYPRAKVAPGSALALRYLENGHVTLPQNQPGKPPKAGTTYVFGTPSPSDTETLANVLAWNSNGTAGDARGVLLAATDFDDGRCHQINSGSISVARQKQFPNPVPGQPGTNTELWCETDVILPSTLTPGSTYTAYWVWDWKTEPGVDPGVIGGKDEYYTTCMDFDVVSAEELAAGEQATGEGLKQQDGNTVAVEGWRSRTALVSDPDVGLAMMTDWGSVSWAGGVPPTDFAVIASVTRTTTSVPTTMKTSFVSKSSAAWMTTSKAVSTFTGEDVGMGSAGRVAVDVVTTTVVQVVTVTAA